MKIRIEYCCDKMEEDIKKYNYAIKKEWHGNKLLKVDAGWGSINNCPHCNAKFEFPMGRG